MDKATVLGVRVARLSLDEMLGSIYTAVVSNRRLLVSNVNITALNLAYERSWLRDFFNRCDLVYCDGMGVLLAARWSGTRLPERFTPADWVWRLAGMAAEQRFSLYLLGNPPGVAERAAQKLLAGCPGLRIAGMHHGFFDKRPGSKENERVVEAINACRPDLLLVGFGMPLQERWLDENWPHLQVKVATTCGALFEYLAGDLKRGPAWMTQHYLEWLARLVISPRRYAGRYLRDIPLLVWRLMKEKVNQRENEPLNTEKDEPLNKN
jgi:N-acetylglucosaminyldiphosphoundecaprenol N-acetyl-beta-D-mannosaminyltransferase